MSNENGLQRHPFAGQKGKVKPEFCDAKAVTFQITVGGEWIEGVALIKADGEAAVQIPICVGDNGAIIINDYFLISSVGLRQLVDAGSKPAYEKIN